MDIRKQFARNLREVMRDKGKRQQDLIRDLGFSSATLSQWVNGKMFPRPSKVETLAEYFGISADALYAGNEVAEEDRYSTIFERGGVFTPLTEDLSGSLYAEVIKELKSCGVKSITIKLE